VPPPVAPPPVATQLVPTQAALSFDRAPIPPAPSTPGPARQSTNERVEAENKLQSAQAERERLEQEKGRAHEETIAARIAEANARREAEKKRAEEETIRRRQEQLKGRPRPPAAIGSIKENLAENVAKHESGSLRNGPGQAGYNAYNKGTVYSKEKKKDVIIGSDKDIDFSKMSIREFLRRGDLKVGDPDKIFAAGKYQIIPDTMRLLIKNMKLDPDKTMLDPKTQDLLFHQGLTNTKRPLVDAYVKGISDDLDGAILELAKEFASVGVPYPAGKAKNRGESYHGGANKATNPPEKVAAALNADRLKNSTIVKTQTNPVVAPVAVAKAPEAKPVAVAKAPEAKPVVAPVAVAKAPEANPVAVAKAPEANPVVAPVAVNEDKPVAVAKAPEAKPVVAPVAVDESHVVPVAHAAAPVKVDLPAPEQTHVDPDFKTASQAEIDQTKAGRDKWFASTEKPKQQFPVAASKPAKPEKGFAEKVKSILSTIDLSPKEGRLDGKDTAAPSYPIKISLPKPAENERGAEKALVDKQPIPEAKPPELRTPEEVEAKPQQKLAKGGIVSNSSAGTTVTLGDGPPGHREAAIPLDPSSIVHKLIQPGSAETLKKESTAMTTPVPTVAPPVDMGNGLTVEMVDLLSQKLDTMIDKLSSSNDTQEKILMYSRS
jgi:muramidase (phage lysozyme)